MSLVDLVVGIVVVTILVTVLVGVATYVAYKLRAARQPASPWDEEETRYFVRYDPDDGEVAGEAGAVGQAEEEHPAVGSPASGEDAAVGAGRPAGEGPGA